MVLSLPDPAASAAVLIGTSTYSDSRLSALPGVANNLADLAAILADQKLWGLSAERIGSFLDCADSADLVESLAEMAGQASDTFIVYYCGHGLLTRELDLMLATRATNPSLSKYTALPYSWVRDVIGRCRAVRRIVILDCCFSGRALHVMSDSDTAVIGQIGVNGIYVMTSAPATSASLAPPNARHTAFTGTLLNVLRMGVPGGGELLSLDDLYDYTLAAMTRRGWPRPQRLGTNTIGRLGILRNRAWGSAAATRTVSESKALKTRADPGRYRSVADGVRDAVTVVAVTLGPTGRDGLDALLHSFPLTGQTTCTGPGEFAGHQAGIELVRETMLAMRTQHGDGAATAAVILGVLVDGLRGLLESGAEPTALDASLGEQATLLAQRLFARTGSDKADTSRIVLRDQMAAAVRTTLGHSDLADAVVAAADAVGAGNVEVVPATEGGSAGTASSFVLNSMVLAPNAVSGAIALEGPLVVVSTDGEIDTEALRAAATTGEPSVPLLIIAPHVSIFAMRSLLHVFPQAVVVRPTDTALDLATLRDRLRPAGTAGWVRARRALVLPTVTTIDRPAVELELSRNRITLTISGPAGKASLAVAARALAVARSAADAGIAPGAGAALRAAAQSQEADAAQDHACAALMRAAACEPWRLIRTAAGCNDEAHNSSTPSAAALGSAVDCLATVRGAVVHAAATASRYLADVSAPRSVDMSGR